MRLNSLHLVNFRQHADTRLEFDLGLTGIIGPNGAGKTTLLEAIAWALYGQSAARGTRDSIRFNRAAPRASVRVELDFELAGHRYRVVRGLTNAELYLDGADQPIANSLTAVSELLQRRLGMSRAEFFNTYFTGQKELNVMAAMGPSERAQFLSRVLGYEKLRGAQELVREQRKLIVAQLSGLRTMMPDPEVITRALAEARARRRAAELQLTAAEQRLQEAGLALGAMAPSWQEAQAAREQLQVLVGELRVVESDEASRTRELERLDAELVEITTARTELETLAGELLPLATVAAEFRRFEDLAREEGRRLTLVEAERSLGEELARLRERREKIVRAPQLEEEVTETLERKRRELEESLGQLEARRTEWVRDRQEAETKRDALRRQYQELKGQRDKVLDLGEDGVCPTCTRILGESFRTVLDGLDEQLETITVDGRYYTTRLEQLEQMPAEVRQLDERRRELQIEVGTLERQLARVQGAVQEVAQLSRDLTAKETRHEQLARDLAAIPTGYDADRHQSLRAETDRLAPLNDRATRLSTLLEREPRLLAERRAAWDDVTRLRTRAVELRRARETIAFSEQEYLELRERQDTTLADARSAEIAVATSKGEVQTASSALQHAERAQQEYERAQAAHEGLQVDKRLHDELDRAFSDLRTDLNHQLRPELSELASAFLAELTDHRYTELELDDQYNVIVLEDGQPKPVISGGEEDLANLVLRLAISQMIAERAGQSFSLLVLDEVFGSLDEVRRHNVVELLRRLSDRFEQVVLITHIESVREGLDRVITVEYDEESGSARVRQPEPELVGAIEGSLSLEEAGEEA
ncbi:MAG TPA: SMC family ATPase [Gemmatimonadaceae bacterium]|nr:SMC family ATPase [Gemmatimonadaceae bacterium]